MSSNTAIIQGELAEILAEAIPLVFEGLGKVLELDAQIDNAKREGNRRKTGGKEDEEYTGSRGPDSAKVAVGNGCTH